MMVGGDPTGRRWTGQEINAPPPPAHIPHVPHNPHVHVPSVQTTEQRLLTNYPLVWEGILALKNDRAAVQMHFISGNQQIANLSLPTVSESGKPLPLRIAKRMKMETFQIECVGKKLQIRDEYCILIALPRGKDHLDVNLQTTNLREGFISYLSKKKAAGIVISAPPGCHQPTYVIHIFPSCEFTDENLTRIAPDMLNTINEITHLMVIIVTV